MNMRKTLLRRLASRLGIDAFVSKPEADIRQIEVDGQAMDDYFDLINKSRIQKTSEYYGQESNFWELGVYSILLDVCDSRLLYPLLGDALRGDPSTPSKMDLLLDPDESLVAQCFQDMWSLLVKWLEGGPTRKPWCVLDVLQAPCREHSFMRWTRSQILRLNSALYRRYESRLAAWPHQLYAMTSDKFSAEQRASVAQRLLAASRDELDTYSRGIKVLFPTVDALLSHRCRHDSM
jgi:hypothetical protein